MFDHLRVEICELGYRLKSISKWLDAKASISMDQNFLCPNLWSIEHWLKEGRKKKGDQDMNKILFIW